MERPANTLSAFRWALELGVDGLDTDVRFTSDDVPVLFHDATLRPNQCWHKQKGVLPDDLPVRSISSAELGNYDCAYLRGQPILRLEELLALMQHETQPLSLEIKVSGKPEWLPPSAVAAERIAELVQRFGMMNRLEPYSFNSDYQIDLIKAIERRGGRPITDIVPLPFGWVTPDALREIREQGFRVVPWTPNEVAQWESLRALGVDGINTDRPEALLRHLGRLP